MNTNPIIFFDADCIFCNYWVQWIIKRDKKAYFRFAPLKGETAATLKVKFPALVNADSIVLMDAGKVFLYADAVLKIAEHLNGWWPLLRLAFIIPAFLRNALYKAVAKRRHWLHTKSMVCSVPSATNAHLFLP